MKKMLFVVFLLLGAALFSALIGLRSIQIFQALGHGSEPIFHHL